MSTVGESCVAIQTTTNGFYSPLLGQRDIRLLEVLPGDDSDIIVTTLVTVSLDSKPTYAALSYVWGDAKQMSMIECNGKLISITTSLAEALKAFRSFSTGPDAPLRKFQSIWADQLCINQHDVLERNHQVGMMGAVYSSSAYAFIWLGPGNEESDRALDFIDSLQQRLLQYAPGHDAETIGPIVQALPEDMVLTFEDQAWTELEALFSRPWFHRTWTFQEPILAPNRMIACGSKIRGWNTFVHALFQCILLRCREGTLFRAMPFLAIDNIIEGKPEDFRLSRLLYKAYEKQASDPRDRVYALYSLVQAYQKVPVPLEISYAMSVEDVYRSTVRFCIENEGSLDILTYVCEFRNQSDLPSWVPDWRGWSNLGSHSVIGDDLKFHASSMSRPLLLPSSSNDKLILKGLILAIVDHTIDISALKLRAADSFSESWITNAAAAGVPMRFLQGETFQTSYDMTMTMEDSPFHSESRKGFNPIYWAESPSWIAAGQPGPIPQAVLTEYKRKLDGNAHDRCLFLAKDSLGLAPAPTRVGDRVCILLGGGTPFILRPRQDTARTTPRKEAEPKHQNKSNTTSQDTANPARQGSTESSYMAKNAIEATEWTLIGDCYLHGYMRGEAMETVTEDDYVNFTLV